MEGNPTIKKQVYTDRYGNAATPQGGPAPTGGEYDAFDAGQIGPDGLVNPDGSADYQNLARGQQGEGMEDSEIWADMSDENYVEQYRNNVEPQDRREAEALMAEMSSQAREDQQVFDPRKAISDLKKELQKPENRLALGEEALGALNDKIKTVERLIGKPTNNPEELEEKISELQDEVGSNIEEALGSRHEKISTMKEMVETLKDNIDDSRIPDAKKEELKSQLDSLKSDLKRDNVDVREATDTLEGIQKAFKKEKAIKELKKQLETLPAKIPSEGSHHEESAQLATKIAAAVRSDNWTEVNNFITYYLTNDRNKPNNFLPQVIGTIFRELAGGDEDKLDDLLSIIPSETRTLMADAAPGDDANSTEFLNDPIKYKYYGTPIVTSDRLRSSRIDEAGDHLGEEEPSGGSTS